MITWYDVKERKPPERLSVLVSWRKVQGGGVTVREGHYDAEPGQWSGSLRWLVTNGYTAEFWAFMPPPPNGG